MNWAPCLAASWARSSCFWIIDSLSPVQFAWTSAPRTVRGIGYSLDSTRLLRCLRVLRRRAGRRRRPRSFERGSCGGAQAPGALVGECFGPASHVPLGELPAAAVGVEAAD